MPSLSDLKRQGYCQQRAASHGAAVTLLAGFGYYTALFECATRCGEVLGDRELIDLGDGILDIIPAYKIPLEDLFSALQKLSTRFSVALVEYTQTKSGGQFVCLWRINRVPPPANSKNLDDY